MIRVMENIDLAKCGMIYAKAFPMEHWGIDWTAENATEYLRDFFEQKRFVGYVYEEILQSANIQPNTSPFSS